MKKPAAPPSAFFSAAAPVPRGDGSYILSPGKPLPEQLKVAQCAKISGLSRQTIYRLFHQGDLKGRRASRGSIRIFASSLQAHLANTEDPQFWDTRK